MPFRKFGASILNYGVGSFIPQLVGFLLLPVYTRFLSPADYGIADLCSTVGFLFMIVAKLGLPGAVARFYFDIEDPAELGGYIRTVTVFLILESVLLTTAAMALLAAFGTIWFPDIPTYPYFFLALVNTPLAVLPDIQRRLLQAREEARTVAVLNVATAAVGILLNVLFVAVLRWGPKGLLLSTAVTSAVFSGVAAWQMRASLKGSLRRRYLLESLGYGLPLVPNHVGGWLLQLGGRVVVASLGTTSQLGMYAVASKFVQPLFVLETAFATAFVPVYFRLRKRGDPKAREELGQLASLSLGAFAALAFGMSVLAPSLVRFVTPPEYHGAAGMIWIISAGALSKVLYDVFISELYYARRTALVFPLTFAGGVITIAATALLVPMVGATGAAVGATLGLFSIAIASMAVSKGMFELRLPWLPLVGVGMGGTAAAGAAVLLPGGPAVVEISLRMVATGLFLVTALFVFGFRWKDLKDVVGLTGLPSTGGRNAEPP